MRQIRITVLDENEKNALDMLNAVNCSSTMQGDCLKCPFHLNNEVLLSSGRRTACFSRLCGDVLRKDKEK